MRLLGKDAHPLGLETVRIPAQVRVTDAHSKMGSPFNLGPSAVRAANSGPLAANSGRTVWGWPGTQGQLVLAFVHNGEPRLSLGVKVGGLKDSRESRDAASPLGNANRTPIGSSRSVKSATRFSACEVQAARVGRTGPRS